jgi:hypothetical protein
MELADACTVREVIDLALRRFVRVEKQRKLLELYGTGGVRRDYRYRRAR